jgi:hypothetical protein
VSWYIFGTSAQDWRNHHGICHSGESREEGYKLQGASNSCSGYLCCLFCLPRALHQRKPLLFQRLESTEMVPERRPPRGPTGPQPVRGGPAAAHAPKAVTDGELRARTRPAIPAQRRRGRAPRLPPCPPRPGSLSARAPHRGLGAGRRRPGPRLARARTGRWPPLRFPAPGQRLAGGWLGQPARRPRARPARARGPPVAAGLGIPGAPQGPLALPPPVGPTVGTRGTRAASGLHKPHAPSGACW